MGGCTHDGIMCDWCVCVCMCVCVCVVVVLGMGVYCVGSWLLL